MTTGTILDYLAHGPAETADGNVAAFKPGDNAEHAEGVMYQGPWEIFGDGFSEHTRRSARALYERGVQVHLRSLNQDNLKADTPEMAPVERILRPMLRAFVAKYNVEVFQVVPGDAILQHITTHRELNDAELCIRNAHRVIYTVWERDRISDAERSALKRVGQLWVGCAAHRDMLIENDIDAERIRVVPCPYFPDDPHLALQGRARSPGVPRFYHIGKWEPRKAQDQIVGAFMMAFRPGESVLYLKVSPFVSSMVIEDFIPDPFHAVHSWLSDERVKPMGWTVENMNASIKIITRRLPAEELVRLHALGDVYVSLSRGEGFDMPALDAKLAGNLMVFTPSGGTQAFAGEGDARVEATGRKPCHPFYRWPEGAGYVDYFIEEAAARMREVAARVVSHDRRPNTNLEWCSAAVAGANMWTHLQEVIETGRSISRTIGDAIREREMQGRQVETVAPLVAPETGVQVGVMGRGVTAKMWTELLGRHPLLGGVHEITPPGSDDQRALPKLDAVVVGWPTHWGTLNEIGAKTIVLLRSGDADAIEDCAPELFDTGAHAVVVTPTEHAYRQLGCRLPHRVVYRALQSPDRVRVGRSEMGAKVLLDGAFRFKKDTPLAARVAAVAPELSFVWRKGVQPWVPIDVPANVTVLESTADPGELWDGVGCLLVTNRSASFARTVYEAACRGVPIVLHEDLAAVREWLLDAFGATPGVFLANDPHSFASACATATAYVMQHPEGYVELRTLAEKVHRRALAQLDELIRTFLLEPVV